MQGSCLAHLGCFDKDKRLEANEAALATVMSQKRSSSSFFHHSIPLFDSGEEQHTNLQQWQEKEITQEDTERTQMRAIPDSWPEIY